MTLLSFFLIFFLNLTLIIFTAYTLKSQNFRHASLQNFIPITCDNFCNQVIFLIFCPCNMYFLIINSIYRKSIKKLMTLLAKRCVKLWLNLYIYKFARRCKFVCLFVCLSVCLFVCSSFMQKLLTRFLPNFVHRYKIKAKVT